MVSTSSIHVGETIVSIRDSLGGSRLTNTLKSAAVTDFLLMAFTMDVSRILNASMDSRNTRQFNRSVPEIRYEML